VVLFEDEFSLSNMATVSYAWSRRGCQPLAVCKQRRRERQTAMGSYNIASGQITVSFHQKGNYQSFKKHLKKVLYTYRGYSKIIMILDNVRFHHARLLKKWMQDKPQLPTIGMCIVWTNAKLRSGKCFPTFRNPTKKCFVFVKLIIRLYINYLLNLEHSSI